MIRKTGGIWFWRVGRFGGSLYLTKETLADRERHSLDAWILGHSLTINIAIWWSILA